MPEHNFTLPAGRLTTIRIKSEALVGNLLGDPVERDVAVYLPPGHDEAEEAYPLFVGLAGFTGSGLKLLSWQAFGENLPQRLDRLVREGQMGPVVLALPDAFTSLGGNQYIDSVATGRWESFVLEEMIPRLEREFRIDPLPGRRAVFGKSSGGYGALIHALRHGDHWGAVACHSGDMGFEHVYLRDLPRALDELARHDRDVTRFLEHLRTARKISSGEFYAMMSLAMAATYDPDPGSPRGIRLPVDPYTCELIEQRWSNWLRHDPLRIVEQEPARASLRRLSGLFLDCGSRDPYALHYGARAFVRKLEAAGIPHHYEEFDDDHSGIDYRMDHSLPFLWRAVGQA